MRRLFIVSLAFALGCSGTPASGSGCRSNTDCASGQVCVDRECRVICRTDAECGEGRICDNEVCTPGTRRSVPELTSIDGDGTPDGGTDTRGQVTAHHIHTKLLINGAHLAGSEVNLDNGSGAIALTVDSSTDERITAFVPETVNEGQYTLTVQNGVGSDQTDVWVVRGEQGPQGPTGAEGPPGPAGPSGAVVVQLELDEASGPSFADSSGFEHHAAAPVTGITAGSGGHTDSAVEFTGGILHVPQGNTIPDSAQIAVEAWIRPSLPLDATRTIVSKVGAYSLKQVDDRILFTVEAGLGTCSVTSVSPITAGAWAHISGAYNGLTVDVTVDGRNTFAHCARGPIVSSLGSELQVGGLMDSSQNVTEDYSGRVDEVRVRTSAPATAHVRQLYYQWGTSSCTSPHATELFTGWVFGDPHDNGDPDSSAGGSNDMHCLEPGDPGVHRETRFDILHATNIAGGIVHEGNIQDNRRLHCSACVVPAGICFQKDGSHDCPAGFTAEYTGYLYGSDYGNDAKHQRLCIDHIHIDNSTPNQPSTGGRIYQTSTDSAETEVRVARHVRCAVCCGY